MAAYFLVWYDTFQINKARRQFVFDTYLHYCSQHALLLGDKQPRRDVYVMVWYSFLSCLSPSNRISFMLSTLTSDFWYVRHLAGYFWQSISLSVLTCQSNISDVRPTRTVVWQVQAAIKMLISFLIVSNYIAACYDLSWVELFKYN